MDLAEILAPKGVRAFNALSSKKRLFHELADIAEDVAGIPAAEAFNALQERESLGPTGVGNGVALPHARLYGLDRVIGLFVRLEKPLNFDSVDRRPVDLVFALFAPADSGVDHLKALARVSRTLRDSAICAKLRSTENPSALHAILTDRTASNAA